MDSVRHWRVNEPRNLLLLLLTDRLLLLLLLLTDRLLLLLTDRAAKSSVRLRAHEHTHRGWDV